jgi:Protein of unknown function (DUF3570)
MNKKIPSRNSSFASLMSAALALPIVAIPVSVMAQESPTTTASTLPPGAVIGIRSLWYREDGNRMKITEPVLWIKSPIGESWEIAASATVDMVSGASPIIVSNATGKPVQIYTGASITDTRKASDISLTRKYGALNENTVSVSAATSNEEDYDSNAFGLNATFDFNERNTTLAFGIGSRRDRVMSVTDNTLNAARNAKEFLVGVTQLIDRRTLVQTNLTVTKLTGYLDDPYKRTFSFFRDGLSPPLSPVILSRDLRPDSRTQIAWLTRGKRALPNLGAVVSAEYRYYSDTWKIRSHTIAGAWLQTVNDTLQIEAGLRYYSQTAANFYRPEITQRPGTPNASRYTSSDQRLAAFGSIEPSVKVIVKLTEQLQWDISFARYMQRQSWQLGGNGSQAFESLSARAVQSGLVYKF